MLELLRSWPNENGDELMGKPQGRALRKRPTGASRSLVPLLVPRSVLQQGVRRQEGRNQNKVVERPNRIALGRAYHLYRT